MLRRGGLAHREARLPMGRTAWPWIRLAALMTAGAAATTALAQDAPPSLDELIAQLENRSCRYSSSAFEICRRSQTDLSWLWSFLFRFQDEYRCPLGAARCLEKLGPAAKPAVPALCKALLEGPNDYDTGDGFIAPRSAIASALGAIGDPRAIDPLAQALHEARPPSRALTALVRTEPSARVEIVRALGRFGPQAARHGKRIAAVLEERNSDTGFLEARRQEFEQSEALQIATEEIRARSPKGASFTIPWDAVDAARARIDRASEDYVRDLESRAQDPLAHAAAEALGTLGGKEAIPLLRDTLANRSAAAAAAGALANLGASDPDTLDALERMLAADDRGPAARASAARALGTLGNRRSVEPLSVALRHVDLRQAAAEGLGGIGAAAAPALPVLRAILDEPSLAVRTERARNYSIEASRQLSDKIAAVRAIERIAGIRVEEILRPYLSDEDVGHVVKSVLRKISRPSQSGPPAMTSSVRIPPGPRRAKPAGP